jgi:uncharacterized phage-associated protein
MKSPFTGGNVILRQENSELVFRKEKFQYINLYYECEDTKERFTTTEIDEINLFQVYNQYRVKYGIPFPDEIKQIRQMYELPASKMSEILGFGENQYRLYENGDMPSEANGKMLSSIKQPCVFKSFVRNAQYQFEPNEFEKIQLKLKKAIGFQQSNIYWDLIFNSYSRSKINGFAAQSYSKLKNILLFYIEKFGGVYSTKMNKLLFYTDFLSYKKYGMAMSGLAYKAIQYGPVPVRWDRVYSLIDDIDNEIVEFESGNSGTKLCSQLSTDLSAFSTNEMAVLEAVYERFKDTTATEISEISHEEDAWKDYFETKEMIDFNKAFSLRAL